MIRYALKCSNGHVFDSWFKSADAFDALAGAGHLACAQCGVSDVEKTLMAPKVAPRAAPAGHDAALARMRREVERNATYVGGKFAQKARDMHAGLAPDAAIYGEASGAEVRSLIEEGVPVMPLPFTPKQKLQ